MVGLVTLTSLDPPAGWEIGGEVVVRARVYLTKQRLRGRKEGLNNMISICSFPSLVWFTAKAFGYALLCCIVNAFLWNVSSKTGMQTTRTGREKGLRERREGGCVEVGGGGGGVVPAVGRVERQETGEMERARRQRRQSICRFPANKRPLDACITRSLEG